MSLRDISYNLELQLIVPRWRPIPDFCVCKIIHGTQSEIFFSASIFSVQNVHFDNFLNDVVILYEIKNEIAFDFSISEQECLRIF